MKYRKLFYTLNVKNVVLKRVTNHLKVRNRVLSGMKEICSQLQYSNNIHINLRLCKVLSD